ncbi:larval-specific very high density lipoprotein [Colletes latitarsis]|uniref:larval-specific very high density lipoprotein n=1 Tax=Colletes latitarsis TaxID=2605962 RepID=UPI0040361010
MNALIVLLVSLAAAAHAVPAYVPHGKEVTYKYSVDVKSELMMPAKYASVFGIDCRLRVKHYAGDPNWPNSYYVELTNVMHRLYNGPTRYNEHPNVTLLPVPEIARSIESPFVIVCNEHGQLVGLKFVGPEREWSKNIKRAIASMLQLDMVHIFAQSPVKSHSFISREETIHGWCDVSYNVHPKIQDSSVDTNELVVTKIHEPLNCTKFSYLTFNNIEHNNSCQIPEENGMTTASRRVFEIEHHGQEILIKKLIGHSVINYFPWLAKAEAHYLLTNQTLIFDDIKDTRDMQATNDQIDRRITFSEPTTNYDVTGDLDDTQGRHQIKSKDDIDKVKKMLDEAASYLKENHMEQRQPEWKHGQTINRLLYTMGRMSLESLVKVFNDVESATDKKAVTMKNIFLGMVPNVGTTAACLFTRNVIQRKTVSDLTAVAMLSKLPMNVKHPSEQLLRDMEALLRLDESVSVDVRKASILCFSTLVHKTYKNGTYTPLLDFYLNHFNDGFENSPTREMKMTYLMALRNTGVPKILDLLEPIVRGDVVVSENPHMFRVYAMWAIKNVAVEFPTRTHDLLWPVLSNVTLPVSVRIVAYEVLMHQLPYTNRLMDVYWFMVYENNEDLYNYHVETIKGLASSSNPCFRPVQELARKILRFTRMRNVPGPLSTKYHVDSFDETYGHSEAIKVSLIVNRKSGLPYIGTVNLLSSVARKPASRLGVHWYIEGLPGVMKETMNKIFGSAVKGVIKQNVRGLITETAKNIKAIGPFKIQLVLTTLNDNVVTVLHYDQDTWWEVFDKLNWWKQCITEHSKQINAQNVYYDDNYEMHVPTDFGVPAVLATKSPVLDSLKLNMVCSKEMNLTKMQLKMKYQEWTHGEYFMSIYNPIADTWHAIRRTGTRDIVIPHDLTIVYNNVSNSIKITTPRLPMNEYSTVGLLTQAKNYVTVRDETDALTKSCPDCSHIQNVTGVVSNRTHVHDIHSKDNGLRYYLGIYNCEGHVTPLPIAHWYNAIAFDRSEPMNFQTYVRLLMRLRQKVKNDMISSQHASCSNLIKVEPSVVYPASQVDCTAKINIRDTPGDKLHALEAIKVDIRSTMDTKGHRNVSIVQWDANVVVHMSPGHELNRMHTELTRTIPGEKNLKICIDGRKDYSHIDTDPLNVTDTNKKTHMKVTIVAGETTENKCVHDQMDVTVNVIGEMSQEQKHHTQHEHIAQVCHDHMNDPDFHTEEMHVPKTWECIREAVLHSTLRKYTANVELKKVPSFVAKDTNVMQTLLQAFYIDHMNYTGELTLPGNAKMHLDYSTVTPTVDLVALRSTHSYHIIQLPFGDMVWNKLMDNVNFPMPMLTQYVDDTSKQCTVYSRVRVAFNNSIIREKVSNAWTVLSGHESDTENMFKISVQGLPNDRLAMLCKIRKHKIEIEPTDSKVIVKVDDVQIPNHENGVLVPKGDLETYVMKLTANYGHLIIQSKWAPLSIFYTPNSVTVLVTTELRGSVYGLCGSMNSTEIPKMHTPLGH